MQTPRCSSCLLLLCVLPVLVKGDVTSDLAALQEEFYDWWKQTWPKNVGNMSHSDHLDELFDTKLAKVQEFIIAASTIDRGQLSGQHQYSYDVFMDMLSTFLSNYAWRNFGPLIPINFLEGFYLNIDGIVSSTSFSTKDDFDQFIHRLQAWTTMVGQMIDRMNRAIQMGTTNHNVSMRAVPGQISAVISTPPRDSVLYRPFNNTLDTLPLSEHDRNAIRSRALAALDNLWAALDRLRSYIQDTYMLHTRRTYGVHGLPAGRDYYRACLQWHLSVDMSPEQVHQTGLREVDRITQRMRQVMTKQGFNGTIREYYSHLEQDPQFRMGSVEEILAAYGDLIHNRAYPRLPPLFKDIPSLPVVVKPMPYDGPKGSYSGGFEDSSLPGTFYVNVFRINDTKTFSMASLTLHEAVPGHHLQTAYEVVSELPSFQKYLWGEMFAVPFEFPFFTAFTEGWALYAEYLGEEMGVYLDDYEMMGRFGEEIFRACRLVVDTGLHYFEWSRDEAIRYLADHTPMTRAEVEIEIDRYITWPGQACAYKTGELKIKELREKAAAALGSKFDIREFHLLLLNNGRMPIHVMETLVRDHIARKNRMSASTGKAACVHCMSAISLGTYLLLMSLMIALVER